MTAPTPSATRIRTCLPYTEYEYQIQTRNNNKAEQQRNSIYSEPLTCRTKTTAGYPDISVNIGGRENQTELPIYPDSLQPQRLSITETIKIQTAASTTA